MTVALHFGERRSLIIRVLDSIPDFHVRSRREKERSERTKRREFFPHLNGRKIFEMGKTKNKKGVTLKKGKGAKL